MVKPNLSRSCHYLKEIVAKLQGLKNYLLPNYQIDKLRNTCVVSRCSEECSEFARYMRIVHNRLVSSAIIIDLKSF